ncbi:MAG TPA: YceI family protein [Chitinophagaceae bacterium]|nr:YceI family protein [Chitinophagaceae bacterium]
MTGIKFLIAVTLLSTGLFAQEKYYTKSGKISFYSKAIIENIEAHNRSVTCVLDTKTGNVQFSVPIKGFEFEKALMQEHFNENYLESDKYPKGEFKGQILNNDEVDYTKDGVYNAKVKGKLTIHGQTNEIETDGKVTKEGNRVSVSTEFNVRLPDYKIKNEKLQNISNSIKVTVNCSLDPLKS